MTWSYTELGGTRTGTVPAGYRGLKVRHRLGHGDLRELGEALLTWRVHAAAGVSLHASSGRAAPGVDAETRLGVGRLRLHEPCRVVWVEETDTRVGFGYGTLPGHVFVGEEAFLIERDDASVLWFRVEAFSRPAWRIVRWAGPTTVLAQRFYLALLARGARRVLREAA